jgi:hypothetical protein
MLNLMVPELGKWAKAMRWFKNDVNASIKKADRIAKVDRILTHEGLDKNIILNEKRVRRAPQRLNL